MNTILRGIIDLLADAVEALFPNPPAVYDGPAGSADIRPEPTRVRKAGALLFLGILALAPPVVMALMMG